MSHLPKCHLLDAKTNLLFAHCFPRGIAALEEECTKRQITMASFSIPAFAISVGTTTSIKVPLFPLERKEEATGLSVLPFIYAPGHGQVTIPKLVELKNELASLQRTSPLPMAVNPSTKVAKMLNWQRWAVASREVELLWPQPKVIIEPSEYI